MKEKKLWIAYLCWFPLGMLGLHRFYLRHYLSGLLFFVTGGGCFIGWIIDLFLIPSMVNGINMNPNGTFSMVTYNKLKRRKCCHRMKNSYTKKQENNERGRKRDPETSPDVSIIEQRPEATPKHTPQYKGKPKTLGTCCVPNIIVSEDREGVLNFY